MYWHCYSSFLLCADLIHFAYLFLFFQQSLVWELKSRSSAHSRIGEGLFFSSFLTEPFRDFFISFPTLFCNLQSLSSFSLHLILLFPNQCRSLVFSSCTFSRLPRVHWPVLTPSVAPKGSFVWAFGDWNPVWKIWRTVSGGGMIKWAGSDKGEKRKRVQERKYQMQVESQHGKR